MLEVLYATGLRVSELISLTLDQLELEAHLIRTIGKGSKERLVPVGQAASSASAGSIWKRDGHPCLKSRWLPWVFLNNRGRPMSRQGFWKILRHYGRQAGITEKDFSSHPEAYLRHPSAGRRGRSAFHSDHAGPCRYFHHPDLHPGHPRTPPGSLPEISSSSLIFNGIHPATGILPNIRKTPVSRSSPPTSIPILTVWPP